MFPYPSAEGLHVGNLFAFTGNDIYGRFQRLQGHTVFEPLGYDAFGIHSENYALKVGEHPMRLIPRNIANFRRQLERAGLMVDWRYALSTRPIRATTSGRSGSSSSCTSRDWPTRRRRRSTGARTTRPCSPTSRSSTARASGAARRSSSASWSSGSSGSATTRSGCWTTWTASTGRRRTKTAQRNWIGQVRGGGDRVSRAGPEELAGAATGERGESGEFVAEPGRRSACSPRGPTRSSARRTSCSRPSIRSSTQLTTDEQRADGRRVRERTRRSRIWSRARSTKEKTGVFTGAYAHEPGDRRSRSRSGSPTTCSWSTAPARSWPCRGTTSATSSSRTCSRCRSCASSPARARTSTRRSTRRSPRTTSGRLVNSGAVRRHAVRRGEARDHRRGSRRAARRRAVVNYRLHDWCISRQRYWGPPIPIIYCDACGTAAGAGEGPAGGAAGHRGLPARRLRRVAAGARTRRGIACRARSAAARRVARRTCRDTFLDSAWYFLRYPSADRDDVPFDAALTQKWLPVTSYIGGNEHAVLHLLYSRFITMVLHDMGILDFEEPFTRFRAHGTSFAKARRCRRAGQRRQPRPVHRAVGRGHVPHVPHVPRSVRGGRRLPRPVASPA